jgi:dynein regulatry complex protein 1
MDMITDEAGFLLEPKVRQHVAELPTNEAGKVQLDALLVVLGVTDVHGLEALVAALDPTSDVELRAKGLGTAVTEKAPLRDPPVLVAPDDIIKRLRAFVEAESASLQGGGTKSKAAVPRLGVSRRVMMREREFWHKVANVVDERGLRVWSALERNLEKYHQLLQGREQGLRQVESLGQQNIELRALLNQYLSSQINSELQVPPTQLI